MSSVKVIRALLVANSNLVAVVPSTRIIAGVLPQSTVVPALCVTEISTLELPNIDAQATKSLVSARVQVTIFSSNYATQKQVLDLVRKACNYERGNIASTEVVSVQRLHNGPDFHDLETGLFMQSIDFKVIFNEDN